MHKSPSQPQVKSTSNHNAAARVAKKGSPVFCCARRTGVAQDEIGRGDVIADHRAKVVQLKAEKFSPPR